MTHVRYVHDQGRDTVSMQPRQSVGGQAGRSRSRGTRLALVLAAFVATLSVSLSSSVALADGGRHHHHAADATFTKWVTSPPPDPSTSAGTLMTGIVGGDVGRGRYAGEVLGDDTTSQPGFWLGHARYEFHGHKDTFMADLHITEDDRSPALITATIDGVVTDGWLEGAHVTGQYRQWDTCPIPTPGNVNGTICFQGTLHLEPAQGRRDQDGDGDGD
jgi:hypothetical protein